MLFWCFFITYLLLHNCNINTHRRYILLLFITFIFTIINPFARLPLGLGSVGYYYFYFLLGFLLRSEVLSLPLFNSKNVFIAILLFIFSYVGYMLVRNSVVDNVDHFHKIIKLFISNSLHFFNAMSAIFLIYGFSNSVKIVHFLENKHSLIILSGYYYGVYIYQQFILRILYYKTSFSLYINNYCLPWIAFAITLCLSLILCHVTLKCKLVRFLIG